jgi:hypothetical protein
MWTACWRRWDNAVEMGKVVTERDAAEAPMKVVGRRRWAPGLAASAPLLRMVVQLRGNRPFLPKGVHRFRSFEEAEEWTLRMLTRPPKPGHLS